MRAWPRIVLTRRDRRSVRAEAIGRDAVADAAARKYTVGDDSIVRSRARAPSRRRRWRSACRASSRSRATSPRRCRASAFRAACAPRLLVGWLAQGVSIVIDIAGIGSAVPGARFGFAPALSVTLWLVLAVYELESRFVPLAGARRALAALGVVGRRARLALPGRGRIRRPRRSGRRCTGCSASPRTACSASPCCTRCCSTAPSGRCAARRSWPIRPARGRAAAAPRAPDLPLRRRRLRRAVGGDRARRLVQRPLALGSQDGVLAARLARLRGAARRPPRLRLARPAGDALASTPARCCCCWPTSARASCSRSCCTGRRRPERCMKILLFLVAVVVLLWLLRGAPARRGAARRRRAAAGRRRSRWSPARTAACTCRATRRCPAAAASSAATRIAPRSSRRSARMTAHRRVAAPRRASAAGASRRRRAPARRADAGAASTSRGSARFGATADTAALSDDSRFAASWQSEPTRGRARARARRAARSPRRPSSASIGAFIAARAALGVALVVDARRWPASSACGRRGRSSPSASPTRRWRSACGCCRAFAAAPRRRRCARLRSPQWLATIGVDLRLLHRRSTSPRPARASTTSRCSCCRC